MRTMPKSRAVWGMGAHTASVPSWLLKPPNKALDAPEPEVAAAIREARERNRESVTAAKETEEAVEAAEAAQKALKEAKRGGDAEAIAKAKKAAAKAEDYAKRKAQAGSSPSRPSPRRAQVALTEPTAEVRAAICDAARRSAARATDNQPVAPSLTPAAAEAKAKAEKAAARRPVNHDEPEPDTARVALLRRALPEPKWSWRPLPSGPKLVDLSLVRLGEGALRYAVSFGGTDPTGRPSATALALDLTATMAHAAGLNERPG